MAWGRKAARIADLEQRYRDAAQELNAARGRANTEGRRADRVARDNDELKRQVDHLEKAKKAANDEAAARRVALRESETRVRELEWAVHLLNTSLSRKIGADVGDPFTAVLESTLETAREAVTERDIVVTWDDLSGQPEVHFPKKGERRAPWDLAAGGFIFGTTLYDPSLSSQGPFSPIGNPA